MLLPRHGVTTLAIALLGLLAICSWHGAAAQTAGDPTRAQRFVAARNWGYQLEHLDPARLATAPYDVLVIDYARDGAEETALTPAELAAIKRKPDGSQRIVLAYMSIGEAETYRYYWNWTWGGSWYGRLLSFAFAPRWLGRENGEWGGNYAVRYWDDGWQRIILGDGGYLDRIVRAGFDGVYLDKIDSSLEAIGEDRPTAKADMRTFVARIAERGRRLSPGFLVVPQNGEELLDDAAYVALINGMGKEDLLYGEFKDQVANPRDVVARRSAQMAPLRVAGKPILAVEYLDDPKAIADARRILSQLGYVPHFGDRDLSRMRFTDVSDGAAAQKRKSKRKRRWFW
ncbi:MAG: MJ1477/TM1410 family putative glycoside hydrolase [Hyphomicrobiaceae bacterium]